MTHYLHIKLSTGRESKFDLPSMLTIYYAAKNWFEHERNRELYHTGRAKLYHETPDGVLHELVFDPRPHWKYPIKEEEVP